MTFRTSDQLTNEEIERGLKLVVKDGLAAEAMATLTGGTFLVAIALHLGASNFQIGLLASLPTFTNIFQLVSIWLVQRYNNRRAVTVVASTFARFPLFVIGILPFVFTGGTSVKALIFLLSFHYFFGSVAGTSWNSWMKDLVPTKMLGTYFSHRGRLTQIVNVTLSLSIAMALDFVKDQYPQYEYIAYSLMFVAGGIIGMIGLYMLSRTPEPASFLAKENMFKLFKYPLMDKNYRKLLIFQSFWAFALNMATPFFSVYMMKTLKLPLSYIVALGILAQLSGIFSIKMWGRYADRFSNKTIINIAAPLYILCIFGWTFTSLPATTAGVMLMLVIINIVSGVATSGINLSIGNIGLKLAKKEQAIIYISARSMVVAAVSSIAPLAGGIMADFFASHQLQWNIQWSGPKGQLQVPLLHLHSWNFFFIIGSILAMFALRLLRAVKEDGEVEKDSVIEEIRTSMRKSRRAAIRTIVHRPAVIPAILARRVASRKERRGMVYHYLHEKQMKRA